VGHVDWSKDYGFTGKQRREIIFRFNGEVLPNEAVSEWVLHQ
jgi:hypothetical protein